MESQRNENSFVPVDPFKASISFSIKNIWQRRHEATNAEANDIYSRPAAPLKTLTHPYLPIYGLTASEDANLNAFEQIPAPRLFGRRSPPFSPSDEHVAPVSGGEVVLTNSPIYLSAMHFAIDPDPGSDHPSRSRSHSRSNRSHSRSRSSARISSVFHSPVEQQSTAPSLLSSASVRTAPNVNPAIASPRYFPSQASVQELASATPPLNNKSYSTTTYILAFILDTIPRQVYLHLLLRLPYMYFSRVARVFEEAEMSMPQIKQGILQMAMQKKEPLGQIWLLEQSMENVPFKNLQNTWQAFIDSLLREWKTLNIISVLLLSAILTILQIDGASKDPLTRYAALLSMICALMSLLYGCVYIIRFGTMRKSYKAAEWANEAQKTKQSIMWNIWVLLAMPATWLAWSIILFIVCIMSFVWRTGTVEDDSEGPMTRDQVLVARIIVTLVLSLGLVYLVLMIATLRRYGEMMDHAWRRRILGWVNDTLVEKVPFASEKVNAKSVPTPNPSVSPPIDTSTGMRAWTEIVAPATNTNPIPPREPEGNEVQIQIPATQFNTIMIKDTAPAMSASALELSSLPPGEHSDQLLHRTEVEESENRPKSPQGIDMMELYSIASLPNKNIVIKRENLAGSNDKVWDNLPPDGWDMLEEDLLLLPWNADSPERILPTLDQFNQASADAIGGQLALCQKFQSDESKYAIFFFSFTEPLPHDQNRYKSIPFDLDSLDIWLSPPSAPSSSLDPGMDTKVMKVSLPFKRSNDTQSASIISPITQPGVELPLEEMR